MGNFINKITIISLIALISSFLISCDDEGCIESVVAYTNGSLNVTTEDPIDINSYSVWGIGQERDSAMLRNSTNLTGIELLLNPNTDYTDLRFQFNMPNDTVTDTITFYYKSREYFLNIDCGCSAFFDIETIDFKGHFITDAEIINPEVTNEKKINFKLFY